MKIPARAQAVRRAVRFMGESLKDARVVHDVECGLHSGFPLCCVVFFVKVIARLDHEMRPHGVDHVPCPRCLIERTFVKAKPCDCNAQCIKHLRREV